ncbi:hypothetical protein, partial [Veillonella magna]|uniref:hypothetical protein n=1 Tax=Veillonella magna TaxID=464322 RepID=UPI0026670FA6
AQVLWYVLMHYNNTCSWKKQFSVPMSMLMTSTRLSASSVKRARIALQKAGRIRYSVRPGKKATVYEMISMEEEGIVTSFLSGNSTAIATDISDSEDQSILQNENQNILENEGQKEGLDELLPERLAERLAERLPERILKLNETRLNISKESTKKGSEAILVEPQEKRSDETQTLYTEVVQRQKYCSNETQATNDRSWQDMTAVVTDTLNIKRIILNDVIYLMQMCNSRQKGGLPYETSLGTVVIARRHSYPLANGGG